jgi:AcrR family transcriptional regulator
MQNVVLAGDGAVAERVAARTLAARSDEYADEVRRLIDAGYAVMRRTGSIDPRVNDIVREAGLSNAAFYRHFKGKDELMLALLDDGRRRLVDYLAHRMNEAEPGPEQVRRWIEGVMEQARNESAAENTRPFAINDARLADRYANEMAWSRELLVQPLHDAIAACGSDHAQRDAEAVYQLVMSTMEHALVTRARPSRADVEHLVRFALRGLGDR